MADRARNLGSERSTGGRTRNLGPRASRRERQRNLGGRAAPAGEHHGLLGTIVHGVGQAQANLGRDVISAVTGLPAGVVRTVEHPVGSAKAIGRSYAQTYGPLTHGDLAKFLHNLYEHPLGPILDVLTVATAGAGGAAKAGGALAKAGAIPEGSRLAQLGRLERLTHTAPSGKVLEGKTLSRNPLIRAREKAVARMLDRLPEQTPHFGSVARYGNELLHLPRHRTLVRRQAVTAYNKAVRGLSHEEFAALHLIGRGVHPADYLAFLRRQEGHVRPEMLRVLENPKVVGLVEEPTPKLLRAVDAARALSKEDAAVKREFGLLSEETAAAREHLHRSTVADELGEVRPMPHEPFYVPDVPVVSRVANSQLEKMGGGVGVPKAPGSVHQNKLVLFRSGQIALHPDILGPEYLRTLKYAHFDDIHSELMASARRVSGAWLRDHGLPEGWVFVRKKIVGQSGRPRPQRIHRLTQVSGEQARSLRELIPDPEGELPAESPLTHGFGTADRAGAETVHGDYLIVPKRLADTVGGEFQRSSKAVRLVLDKPTRVWRALILGYRVGFLTNNVVGNHLLYALRFAGHDGLRGYLGALAHAKGLGAVRALLEDPATPKGLRREFLDEFFPETTQTFGATQKARFRSPKTRALARAAGTGIMPATQAAAETFLRRAATEAALRSTPEVRAALAKMPRETRYFEAAARKAIDDNPAVQREVVQRVNAALGDYTNLGPLERHTIRAAFPFYAWYRAITTIVSKLALDAPGRANLVQKLSQVGDEWTRDELGQLPAFLRGLVPVGREQDGKHKVLSTQGLNPLATVQQLGEGGAGVLTGRPGEVGKSIEQLGLNPFVVALIQSASGKDLFTGRDISGGPRGLPAQLVATPAGQLPQTQLLKALRGHGRESKLYGKQTAREAVLQQLGVPIKKLDLARARSYAAP